MLNAIVDAALRYKVLVLVAFAVIVGLGIQAFREVPVDAFPDVTPIQVNVIHRVARPRRRGRGAPAHHADRRRDGRPARCRRGAFGLALRPVPRRRLFQGQRRHLLRPPPGRREAARGKRNACRGATWRAGARAEQLGPRPGVLVHDRVGRQEAVGDGPAHAARLDRAADPAHRAGVDDDLLGRPREAVPGADRPAQADQKYGSASSR